MPSAIAVVTKANSNDKKMEIFLIILAVIVGLFLLTFAIYWFNLDMKLIRFVYDKLQKHYDNMKRDKKL